ncbi:uncharacterized protein LOC112518317 [Cynara cardunculus var. scolymus]|uniref:DUF7705 domain-containing protein n=1 Tax=Cynara cardunculus var. scolymus TaxID=59895 RepID=A0A103XPI9_CYNCS|nr:uncharacterized protein LOC112518317 [Cynara cardunculus var. scolymus]KVH94553.1 hypothetical protein Ccrd_003384 [Cynara cardunculus var. scolymus]
MALAAAAAAAAVMGFILVTSSLMGNIVAAVSSMAILETSSTSSSCVGDPGMKRDGLRVAFEAWNFCNEVGTEAPSMGSPRAADCFDLSSTNKLDGGGYYLNHKVTEADNRLGVGNSFPGLSPKALQDPDLYAAEKELYLGTLCQVIPNDTADPWQFWMIMLKNGNYDTTSALCPQNGKKVPPFPPGRFPCFGDGCMNQPVLAHQPTSITWSRTGSTNTAISDLVPVMRGGFNGSYDDFSATSVSYFEVTWEKSVGVGSWEFNHKLKTSHKYPWLMLYLRADATKGFSGGYHYDTRGMLNTLPESPNFKVRLSLDVKKGGGAKSQFYLIDMGSCWKNNGDPCDGDVLTDITRYSEMIINPEIPAWCGPSALENCPPYHITPNNTKIYRNNTRNFPYGAYHYYCAPGNAQHLEKPYSTCDPYSNPQAQELVQLLPHPIWREYGYPTKQGEGWVGDARSWELDVGGLSARLYFYQDPGSKAAKRVWTSLDVGTEIFVSNKDEEAEWRVSDFDVIIT